MRGLKAPAVVLALLLLGSLVPLTMAENVTNSTGSNGTNTYVIDNATREQVIATQLIKALERLSKLAENRIEPIKDKLPENSSIIQNYEQAETYRERTLDEYDQSDYCNAILDGLTAMHYYRKALQELKEGREGLSQVQAHVRDQMERMNTYLNFVRKTINLAEMQGIDVENLTRAYNETVETYRAVLTDMREKNLTKIREDIEMLKERKAVLDEELRKVREELAYANADKIVKEFLVRGEREIQIVQKAIQIGQEKGYNVTKLQESLHEFMPVYDRVKNLADEGKWKEAFKAMQENREPLEKFHRTVTFVMRKAHEREAQRDMKNLKAFLRGFSERVQRDEKALQELRKQGVDTRRAEAQLRVAVQEVNLGIHLIRERKPQEAKIHFEIALDVLNRVEDFIVAHS
jgi:tetratricopeptide (TPR) repeat protein